MIGTTPDGHEWNVGQDDPFDHYPWTWEPYLDADGGPTMGSISTPNVRRPDGTMHTFWGVLHQVWEPHGHLICDLVNKWAHDEFGTPLAATSAAGTEQEFTCPATDTDRSPSSPPLSSSRPATQATS